MSQIQNVLREEIRRIVQLVAKEKNKILKQQLVALKVVNTELEKRVKALEKEAKTMKETWVKIHPEVELKKEKVAAKTAAADKGQEEAKSKGKGKGKGKRASGLLGKRIKRIREKLRLNPGQFAKLLGVSRLTITMWESDKFSPQEKTQQKIFELQKMPRKEIKKLFAASGIVIERKAKKDKKEVVEDKLPANAFSHVDAAFITNVRTTLNLTQEELAVILKSDAHSISMWEHGKVVPRAKMRQKIAALPEIPQEKLKEYLDAYRQTRDTKKLEKKQKKQAILESRKAKKTQQAQVAAKTLVGERMLAFRKKYKLPREALASIIGATAGSVLLWENNKTFPQAHYRDRITALENMPAAEIVAKLAAYKQGRKAKLADKKAKPAEAKVVAETPVAAEAPVQSESQTPDEPQQPQLF